MVILILFNLNQIFYEKKKFQVSSNVPESYTDILIKPITKNVLRFEDENFLISKIENNIENHLDEIDEGSGKIDVASFDDFTNLEINHLHGNSSGRHDYNTIGKYFQILKIFKNDE